MWLLLFSSFPPVTRRRGKPTSHDVLSGMISCPEIDPCRLRLSSPIFHHGAVHTLYVLRTVYSSLSPDDCSMISERSKMVKHSTIPYPGTLVHPDQSKGHPMLLVQEGWWIETKCAPYSSSIASPTITGEPGLNPDEVGVEFSEAWTKKKRKNKRKIKIKTLHSSARPPSQPSVQPIMHRG